MDQKKIILQWQSSHPKTAGESLKFNQLPSLIMVLVAMVWFSFSNPLFAIEMSTHFQSKTIESFDNQETGNNLPETKTTLAILGNRFVMRSPFDKEPSINSNFDPPTVVGGVQMFGATNARGFNSVAIGYGAKAQYRNSTSIGKTKQNKSEYGFIGGGSGNSIETSEFNKTSNFSTILGGENNTIIDSNYSSIVAGKNNRIESAHHSIILGGENNISQHHYQTVAGAGNIATRQFQTVLGQYNDHNEGRYYNFVIGNGDSKFFRSNGFLASRDGVYSRDMHGASDRRLKENFSPYYSGLKEILALNPVKFKWKDSGKDDIGLIAQEVYPILPETINRGGTKITDDDWRNIKFPWIMSYGGLSFSLINALKEQNSQITDQKQKIQELNEMISLLKQQVTLLEQQ